jgi:hypothetical protein
MHEINYYAVSMRKGYACERFFLSLNRMHDIEKDYMSYNIEV